MPGEFAARKLKKDRKRFRWRDPHHTSHMRRKAGKTDNALGGAPQGKGIVVEKTGREQKQPSSGIIKCARVQLVKNGKTVTAHLPKDKAKDYVDEHDEVIIEGLGGSQGGGIGTMWGIKYRVVKVNGIALQQLRTGKKEKPRR